MQSVFICGETKKKKKGSSSFVSDRRAVKLTIHPQSATVNFRQHSHPMDWESIWKLGAPRA